MTVDVRLMEMGWRKVMLAIAHRVLINDILKNRMSPYEYKNKILMVGL